MHFALKIAPVMQQTAMFVVLRASQCQTCLFI